MLFCSLDVETAEKDRFSNRMCAFLNMFFALLFHIDVFGGTVGGQRGCIISLDTVGNGFFL